MMSTDRFKVQRVRSYLVGAPGTREMTRFLLAAADRLTGSRHQAIDRHAADLAADLAGGRLATHSVTARDQIERFPAHPPPAALVRLACLYPGISKAWYKDRSAAADPLSALRNGSDQEQRTRAAEWLAWAVDQVEGLRLLPPPLRRKLLGDRTRAVGGDGDDAVADLAALTAALPVERQRRDPAGRDAVAALDAARGRALAEWAVELIEGGTVAGAAVAADLLNEIACLVPGALTDGLRARAATLASGGSVPGVVFRGGGPETRAALLGGGPPPAGQVNGWLVRLAWLGDAAVQKQFARWRRARKKFDGTFVRADRYCVEAGWELTPAGRRRDLCFDTCFALVPPGRRAGTASDSPVRVGTLTGGDCGRCGHPLHNLLDVDLSDRRFAFLKVRAARLPVPACLSCFDWTYATFDRAGRAAWSPRTPEPEFEADDYAPLSEGNLVLGPPTRTPLEPTLGSPSSAVGGYPFWINDAEFPACPKCRRPMPLVGHVDLGAVGADGIGYAYACGGCRTTAANFRCT